VHVCIDGLTVGKAGGGGGRRPGEGEWYGRGSGRREES
jgi:hypothetical protein